MSRLADIREQDAIGKAVDIFVGIEKAVGKVSNAYFIIGGHSSMALQQALTHNAMFHEGSLSTQQLETVNLLVSEATGCDYCLAAYTLMARRAGFSSEQARALRRGEYAEEAQLGVLVKFAQTLVTTTGMLPEADVAALCDAGFSDQQMVEIISATSAVLFTNMVNRVSDTVVDFPKTD